MRILVTCELLCAAAAFGIPSILQLISTLIMRDEKYAQLSKQVFGAHLGHVAELPDALSSPPGGAVLFLGCAGRTSRGIWFPLSHSRTHSVAFSP
jgi:hypothetical protein